MQLWMRQAVLILNKNKYTLDGLNFSFKVQFEDRAKVSTAQLEIRNLAPSTRAALKKGDPVILSAGYRGDVGCIFVGAVAEYAHSLDGLDVITRITAADSLEEWLGSWVNKTYKAGMYAADIIDDLLNIFGGFDSQLHDMVERAFDEAWIDFYPRNGKVGGAFDCGVPSARQSRVLTNFDGAFGDIVTLAHELGHAFHDQQVFTHPLICQEYSMPVAETASTFNEVLTVTAAIQAAQDKDEKLALIESQLSDACQIICDIYSRFLFESSVFEARPQEFLDADRLCQLMLEAQKKAYGDGLDQTCLHPYMWLCKGHYYSGSLSFYNFPYAFGGLFARGLYAKYQQEGEKFVPLYKEMLHATSVNDVEDTAKIAGIDLTDKAFWRQGLQSLADEIDLFCDLVK